MSRRYLTRSGGIFLFVGKGEYEFDPGLTVAKPSLAMKKA
jgi:hypothetical protein